MKLKRFIFNEFVKKIKPNKVLLLLGARRVGKTELIKEYLTGQTHTFIFSTFNK